MVTVDDRPFLAHLLELLGNNGITDVILCIGYLGDQIREYLRDGRKFGMKGILVAVVAGIVLWKLGIVDPNMLLGGGSAPSAPTQISPEEQERYEFVSKVLGVTEEVWASEFSRIGRTYEEPKMQIYRGQTRTACGTGSAAMGPFYCPGDSKVYFDLSYCFNEG